MSAAREPQFSRRLRRLRWWWVTRNCDCHWQEPYGPVVMVGCPLHD